MATGLHPGAPAREKSESDRQHRQVLERELKDLIAWGDVGDAPTVAAYGLPLLDEVFREPLIHPDASRRSCVEMSSGNTWVAAEVDVALHARAAAVHSRR